MRISILILITFTTINLSWAQSSFIEKLPCVLGSQPSNKNYLDAFFNDGFEVTEGRYLQNADGVKVFLETGYYGKENVNKITLQFPSKTVFKKHEHSLNKLNIYSSMGKEIKNAKKKGLKWSKLYRYVTVQSIDESIKLRVNYRKDKEIHVDIEGLGNGACADPIPTSPHLTPSGFNLANLKDFKQFINKAFTHEDFEYLKKYWYKEVKFQGGHFKPNDNIQFYDSLRIYYHQVKDLYIISTIHIPKKYNLHEGIYLENKNTFNNIKFPYSCGHQSRHQKYITADKDYHFKINSNLDTDDIIICQKEISDKAFLLDRSQLDYYCFLGCQVSDCMEGTGLFYFGDGCYFAGEFQEGQPYFGFIYNEDREIVLTINKKQEEKNRLEEEKKRIEQEKIEAKRRAQRDKAYKIESWNIAVENADYIRKAFSNMSKYITDFGDTYAKLGTKFNELLNHNTPERKEFAQVVRLMRTNLEGIQEKIDHSHDRMSIAGICDNYVTKSSEYYTDLEHIMFVWSQYAHTMMNTDDANKFNAAKNDFTEKFLKKIPEMEEQNYQLELVMEGCHEEVREISEKE